MFQLSVTQDEPGQRLVLQETGAVSLPNAAGLGCFALVITVFGLLPLRSVIGLSLSSRTPLLLVFVAAELLFCAVLARGFWHMLNATRRVVLLDANGAAGELRIEDRSWVGWPRRTRAIPLETVTGATVEAVIKTQGRDLLVARISASGPPGVAVRLRLRSQAPDGKERSDEFRLFVEGLDRHDEVADLALRLAAACRIGYYEITRRDPRQVSVELHSIRSGLVALVPVPERRAGYAKDRVAAAARKAVAEERLPPFDPLAFSSEFRVTHWEPGILVAFKKPMQAAAIGCLPFSLLMLAGPIVFLQPWLRSEPAARVALSVFALVFGVLLGSVALSTGLAALPRRVRLDWLAGRITFWRPGKTRAIAIGDVSAVELTCLRYTPSKGPTTYHCEVKVVHADRERGHDQATALIETRSFASDPDAPYAQSLPLATELSQALRVPRRVTDYA